VDNKLLNDSIILGMFKDGAALYGSFIMVLVFIVIGSVVQVKREMHPDRLGQLSRFKCFVKAAASGLDFGTEVFLIAAIWENSTGIALGMIMFRLLHLFGALFLLISTYVHNPEILRYVGYIVRDARSTSDLIDKEFTRDNVALVCTVSLSMMCDLSMVEFLPWKQSKFFQESHGLPSMYVLKFYLEISVVHSIVSVICEIAYLATYSGLDDATTGEQAKALFGLNIAFSIGGLFLSFIMYVLKGELLRGTHLEMKQEIENRAMAAPMHSHYGGTDMLELGTVRDTGNPLHSQQNQPSSGSVNADTQIAPLRQQYEEAQREIESMRVENDALKAAASNTSSSASNNATGTTTADIEKLKEEIESLRTKCGMLQRTIEAHDAGVDVSTTSTEVETIIDGDTQIDIITEVLNEKPISRKKVTLNTATGVSTTETLSVNDEENK
jgi:hypothetical protein